MNSFLLEAPVSTNGETNDARFIYLHGRQVLNQFVLVNPRKRGSPYRHFRFAVRGRSYTVDPQLLHVICGELPVVTLGQWSGQERLFERTLDGTVLLGVFPMTGSAILSEPLLAFSRGFCGLGLVLLCHPHENDRKK
jgi:hypothetical protein